ncbi:hypothetical protein JL720_11129 [Aureococcus anophagefferens]|nr:hypothetical protein JL720_11129 [Aureococcus anophagefferens]
MVAVGEWWWVPDEEQCFVPARVTSVAGADARLDADGAPVSCPTAKLTTKIDSPDLLDAQLDDLVQMDQVNHPAIIDTLRRRYRSDKIYTGIADILVAMNPFKWLPVYTPAHVTEYAKGDQEAPPHPFKTTMNAYNGLRESRCAQAILISGESGAGKTETTKQCLKMLSECAGGGRKGEAGVEERLLSTNPVLETLGNAKTVLPRLLPRALGGPGRRIHFAYLAKSGLKANLNPADAEDCRDALAKHAYGALFRATVQRVNAALASASTKKGGVDYSIGALDIFGFEIFVRNSFEQLCINFCNEKLQQHFTKHTFDQEVAVYKAEGVPFAEIHYISNADVIELVEHRARGMFRMLDDEVRAPGGSDKQYVSKLHRALKDHARLGFDKRNPDVFLLKHYAGVVKYEVEGFLVKNKDRLYDDVADCMCASSNALVANLFAPDGPVGHKKGSKVTCSGRFVSQLGDLMRLLNDAEPHYIRCIKPNKAKKPDLFEGTMCYDQLNFAGVFEAQQPLLKMRKKVEFYVALIIGTGARARLARNLRRVLAFAAERYAEAKRKKDPELVDAALAQIGTPRFESRDLRRLRTLKEKLAREKELDAKFEELARRSIDQVDDHFEALVEEGRRLELDSAVFKKVDQIAMGAPEEAEGRALLKALDEEKVRLRELAAAHDAARIPPRASLDWFASSPAELARGQGPEQHRLEASGVAAKLGAALAARARPRRPRSPRTATPSRATTRGPRAGARAAALAAASGDVSCRTQADVVAAIVATVAADADATLRLCAARGPRGRAPRRAGREPARRGDPAARHRGGGGGPRGLPGGRRRARGALRGRPPVWKSTSDLDRCEAALARLLEERRLLGNVLNALHHETMSLDDADALRACGGASVRASALEHATAAAATFGLTDGGDARALHAAEAFLDLRRSAKRCAGGRWDRDAGDAFLDADGAVRALLGHFKSAKYAQPAVDAKLGCYAEVAHLDDELRREVQLAEDVVAGCSVRLEILDALESVARHCRLGLRASSASRTVDEDCFQRFTAEGAARVATAKSTLDTVDDCHRRLKAAIEACTQAALSAALEAASALNHDGMLTAQSRALLRRLARLVAAAVDARKSLDRDGLMRSVAAEAAAIGFENDDVRIVKSYLDLPEPSFLKVCMATALGDDEDELAAAASLRLHAHLFDVDLPAHFANGADGRPATPLFELGTSPALKTAAEFVELRFSDPAPDFALRKAMATMLVWVDPALHPLRSSLTRLVAGDKDGKELARRTFGKIAGFMGDSVKPHSNPDVLSDELVCDCRERPKLVDEAYAQTLKQLKRNPSPASRSRGWELLEALLNAKLAPSSALVLHVEKALRYDAPEERRGALAAALVRTWFESRVSRRALAKCLSGWLEKDVPPAHLRSLAASTRRRLRDAEPGAPPPRAPGTVEDRLREKRRAKRRFFQLKDQALAYYDAPPSATSKPLGVHRLAHVGRVWALWADDSPSRLSFPFVVDKVGHARGALVLSAPSAEERASWMASLEAARDAPSEPEPPAGSSWLRALDHKTGKAYYWNRSSLATTWDPPPAALQQ